MSSNRKDLAPMNQARPGFVDCSRVKAPLLLMETFE
jgi:hypothetical protein